MRSGVTVDVQLDLLTDDELTLAFDELCGKLGDCPPDDRRGHHDALMLVCQEYGRRADVWLAARQTSTLQG